MKTSDRVARLRALAATMDDNEAASLLYSSATALEEQKRDRDAIVTHTKMLVLFLVSKFPASMEQTPISHEEQVRLHQVMVEGIEEGEKGK